MSEKKPQFFQFRLPEDYFDMPETDQKKWIAEYLKTSLSDRLMSKPQKDEDQDSNKQTKN